MALLAAGAPLDSLPASVGEAMTGPSEDQIAEWQRLTDEATPGPWLHLTVEDGDECGPNGEERPTEGWTPVSCAAEEVWFQADTPADAAFIAAAREAVPALLADRAATWNNGWTAASEAAERITETERAEHAALAARLAEVTADRDGLFARCEQLEDLRDQLEVRLAEESWDEGQAVSRVVLDLQARAERAEAERDEARAAVERVEALAEGPMSDGYRPYVVIIGTETHYAVLLDDLRAELRGEAGEGRA